MMGSYGRQNETISFFETLDWKSIEWLHYKFQCLLVFLEIAKMPENAKSIVFC